MRKLVPVFLLAVCAAGTAIGAEPTLAIVGATLIDGAGGPSVPDSVVLIHAGRIVRAGPLSRVTIPADAERLDASGRFLIPGLCDMHHHLGTGYASPEADDSVANLRDLLRWGVTTVFVPHSPTLEEFRILKALSRKDEAGMPRFFGSGPMVTAPGGHFSHRAAGGLVADTPQRGRIIVEDLKRAGVDAVKIAYDDLHEFIPQALPVMDPRVLHAVIDEAHRQGLKAFVHAPELRRAKEALRAGADGLMHGVLSDPMDDEFIELMRRGGAVYVTTQSLYVDFDDPAAWVERLRSLDRQKRIPEAVFEALRAGAVGSPFRISDRARANAAGNLIRLHQAGIPIVAGTDSGVVGVLPGISSVAEVTLLVEAGMTPDEALNAATLNAAAMFGLEAEMGSIEAGKFADLVILEADPRSDIRNLALIAGVVKGGVVYGDGKALGYAGARAYP